MKKFAVIFSVIALALVLTGCSKVDKSVGGMIHNVKESFDAGIAVNGTEVISSTRGISATAVTSVNGTATSTVAAGSSAIGSNRGKICLWNGASSFTIISFAGNTTTPAYATSTSCQ